MSEAPPKTNNAYTSTSANPTAKSPNSDVSPRTRLPSSSADYFSQRPSSHKSPRAPASFAATKGDGLKALKPDILSPLDGASTGASTTSVSDDSRRPSQSGSDRPTTGSRKSSTASVTFRAPRNPSLPQGLPRKTDNRRLRESSPSPVSLSPSRMDAFPPMIRVLLLLLLQHGPSGTFAAGNIAVPGCLHALLAELLITPSDAHRESWDPLLAAKIKRQLESVSTQRATQVQGLPQTPPILFQRRPRETSGLPKAESGRVQSQHWVHQYFRGRAGRRKRNWLSWLRALRS
ncbi:hypothetical protein B0H66DRAFT_601699 [Apodospora peruviana]|uniref:Uncharacterized protein n=1 Tax=Apodospora peruviana TaxID=516989 RepID=A0AAE0M8V1_9PEZI|nr:hypothetical protein B0H66DRAFT_601699 [Apodospora peruviana]